MLWATSITDASFCQQHRVAGWAAWIRISDHVPIKMRGTFKTQPENPGYAEMMAAINGIWIARQHGAEAVLVQTDCMQVINAIIKRVRKDRIRGFWSEALHNYGLSDMTLKGKHVKGHTSIKLPRFHVNRWCDRNARIGRCPTDEIQYTIQNDQDGMFMGQLNGSRIGAGRYRTLDAAKDACGQHHRDLIRKAIDD